MTNPTLPRQTCRGHLERGFDHLTVGTMPNGDHRPYRTELVIRAGSVVGRFHFCAECAEVPEIAARLAPMADLSADVLVDAHLCMFCEAPVSEEFDPETGPYFPSYHFACLGPHADGRFLVLGTGAHHATSFARIALRRFSTARRAIDEATSLSEANTRYNGTRFAVVDLETNEVLFEQDRDVAAELAQAKRSVDHLERLEREIVELAR